MSMSMSMAKTYIKYYNKYCDIYGKDKTFVFMQVGSFYEAYGTDTEGPDLLHISKLLGVMRSRKGKTKSDTVSIEYPYFLGFPMGSLVKFLEILIENDYIVAIVDQITSNNGISEKFKKGEIRDVTNIYSKGTYIDNIDKKEGNYIVCLYISNDEQLHSGSLISVGMTGIDLSTGHIYTHEAYSLKYDESFALDESERFITNLDPKEIIIYYQNNTKNFKNAKNKEIIKSKDKEYVLNYLKIGMDSSRYYDYIDPKYSKLNFQNEMLGKVYTSTKSMLSPIEQLNLEKNIYSVVSMTILFDFIYNKNKELLNNLNIPLQFSTNKHLVLANNTIRQLDILENFNNNSKCKFRSLFHVVNNTSTAVGERLLKSRILSPFINSNEINKIYDFVDEMKKDELYKKIEKHLDNIRDIERLQRKMELQMMRPFEVTPFVTSYEYIYKIIEEIKSNKKSVLNQLLIDNDILKQITKFINVINATFDVNELDKYSNFEIKTSIFKDGIHKDIDKLKENVDMAHEFMENLRESLDNLINSTEKKWITLQKNNKEGFYLSLTNSRAKTLKDKINASFDKLKEFKVGDKTIDITSKLVYKEVGKNTKIYFPSLDQKSDNIEKYNAEMMLLNKKYYLEEIKSLHNKFNELFKQCDLFIANIDFIKSAAKTSSLYGYVRPLLVDKPDSYVYASKIRHPIIERIIDYEYVPHDIELGNDLKGMLLFGINSSGKSSCMKAIGLNVVMAQAGLYVPAEKFVLSPYHTLFTRITGDDNIFRGLSSFTMEMVEINAIMKRSDKNTLVIGDEVCRGTEHISGNAIVATTILQLAKSEASFIFATHLHEIMKIQRIKDLSKVKPFHLSVSYDEKTKSLIYDRMLKEGSGEEIYGITVAQYIIQDKNFIDTALEIKNELMESFDSIIPGKTSKYNSNIYVYECNLCGKKDKNSHLSQLETHHINFQKDCENGIVKNKKHLKKNQEANLIVLCNECHDKIHSGKIKLSGYVMTSKGKKIISEDE